MSPLDAIGALEPYDHTLLAYAALTLLLGIALAIVGCPLYEQIMQARYGGGAASSAAYLMRPSGMPQMAKKRE